MRPQDRTHTAEPYPLRSRGGKGEGETFARLLAKPKRLERSTRIHSLKMGSGFPLLGERVRVRGNQMLATRTLRAVAQTQSRPLDLSDSSQGCSGVQPPFALTPALSHPMGEGETAPRVGVFGRARVFHPTDLTVNPISLSRL